MPIQPDPTVRGAHELVFDDLLTWDMGCGGGTDSAELRTATCQWIVARQDIGLARYNQPLVPGDGRDGVRDAIEEAADLVAYLANRHRQDQCQARTYHAAVEVLLDLVALSRGITTRTPATTGTPAAEPR